MSERSAMNKSLPGEWHRNDSAASSTPHRAAAAPPAGLQSFHDAPHYDGGLDTLPAALVRARAPSKEEFNAITSELRSFAAMGEDEMNAFVRSLAKGDLISTTMLKLLTEELEAARAYVDVHKAYNEQDQEIISRCQKILSESHETITRMDDVVKKLDHHMETFRPKKEL